MSQSVESSPDLTIQTIDGKGKAPKRRIATPEAGLLAYDQMRQIERRRDLRFNAIAGIYAGFPPTPPEQMEEMGMGDFPNINCKQFQSKVDTYADNWNAINAAGADWFEVEVEHDDPMEAGRRSKLITKHFNCAIRQWDGTDFAVGRHYIVKSATRDKQMGLFGIGVAHFCDPIDFRWEVRPTRKVLVPEGTNLLLDNCPFLAIEDEMSVPDLWAMRDMPGWNNDTICRILYLNTFKNNQLTGRAETLAEWTERVRENDTWQYSDFPLVKFVHLYVKEFSSTSNKASITHCIISDTIPMLSNAKSSDKGPFGDDNIKGMSWLYEKENVATRWSEILSVFSDNAGPEGKWHGVKGFGDLVFDGCHFNNLFFNRTAASAIVANMLLFKGGNEGDRQKMNQIKVTPFGAMIDLEIEQFQLRADTNSAISMFQLGTDIVNSNSRQPAINQTGGGEAPTATQVNFDRADEARFTTLQVSFYRSTGLDCLGAEMYRRIAQPASKYPVSWPGGDVAKEFRDRCKASGIPEADLLKVKYVRANRNTGSGNMGLDVMRADQLLTIATPGEGQRNAQKFKASALVGPDMVGAFVVDEVPPPNFEDVTINQENLCIQGGQTPQAFGDQPHDKHLMGGATQGHLPMLGEIEQLMNQVLEAGLEQNPEGAEKLYRSLIAGIEHAGQHVQFLGEYKRNGKNPAMFETQVKEFNKVLNDLAQFAQSFGEALEQAQQAANPQQGMTPEQMKAQSQIEIDRAKAANDIEIKNAKAMANLEASEAKNAIKAEQSMSAHEVRLAQQAQKEQLSMEARAAKAQQDLIAQRASTAISIGEQAATAQMKAQQPTEQ